MPLGDRHAAAPDYPVHDVICMWQSRILSQLHVVR